MVSLPLFQTHVQFYNKSQCYKYRRNMEIPFGIYSFGTAFNNIGVQLPFLLIIRKASPAIQLVHLLLIMWYLWYNWQEKAMWKAKKNSEIRYRVSDILFWIYNSGCKISCFLFLMQILGCQMSCAHMTILCFCAISHFHLYQNT